MTSNNPSAPPQLHLSIPVNTTSFKRTFEQFGFDLEENNATAGASGSGASVVREGRERREKRARSSESSEDEGSDGSTEGSYVTGRSSETTPDEDADIGNGGGLSATRPLDLHALPTPPPFDRDEDVNMHIDVSDEFRSLSPPPAHETPDILRSSLERFSAFDAQVSALRRSHSPIAQEPSSPVLEFSPTIFDADQTSPWQEEAPSPWNPLPAVPLSPPTLPSMTFGSNGSGDPLNSQRSPRNDHLNFSAFSPPPPSRHVPASGSYFVTNHSDTLFDGSTVASYSNHRDFDPPLLSNATHHSQAESRPVHTVPPWRSESGGNVGE
jgi:hypothetical protein